jgi:putative membrane protein
MMWFGDHMSGWGYALMGIGTILFWGLIVAGIVVLVRYLGRSEQHGSVRLADRPAPEQLLAERFARGEIDEEEYRRRLDTLRASGGPVTRP